MFIDDFEESIYGDEPIEDDDRDIVEARVDAGDGFEEPVLDYRIGRDDETTRDWERRQSQYPTLLRGTR